MKRFEWRLQRVLDVRKKQEQKKITELLQLTEQLAATRGELLLKLKMLENIIKDLDRKNFSTRLAEQEFFLSYSYSTNKQIKKLKEKICKMEPQQKEKIAEVLKIRRLREGLEKMRDEAKGRFIKEQEKLEQKALDETAMVSFTRNSRN